MSNMRKAAGALGALALALSAIVRPADAGDEDPVRATHVTTGVLNDETDTVDPAALREWSDWLAQNPAPGDGCFNATYPNSWEKVDCSTARPRVHPTPVKTAGHR